MEEERITEDQVFALIIYDIVDNRRRNRLERFLRGYGFRVQKSTFEVILRKSKYVQLISKIGDYAASEDSIRVYKIMGKGKVLSFGKIIETPYEETIII